MKVDTASLHPCTSSELSKFYPPDTPVTANKLQNLGDNSQLFCFDWSRLDFEIYGDWQSGLDFNLLEVGLQPCMSIASDEEDCE